MTHRTGVQGSVSAGEDRQPVPETQYILFMAGGAVFAVGLTQVLKIVEPEWWVRIPHAVEWVEGLLYHHGEALVVVNAGALLGNACTPREGTASVIWISDRNLKIGMLVDRVVGTWRSSLPATPSKGASFVKSVWEHKGRLVNLLDVDALLDRASRVFRA